MNNLILTIQKEFNEFQQLSYTLDRLGELFVKQSLSVFQDDFNEIRCNYNLMLTYMSKGYADESRNDLYSKLILRTYKLIQNIQIEFKKNDNPSYHDASNRLGACGFLFDHDSIRKNLETYVTDIAMLSLEKEELRELNKRRLLVEHDLYMSRLFDYILLSYQWNESDVSFYISLLTSLSIDTIDAQWIIGAISVACNNIFDLKKLELLANVYTSDVAEPIRQRALVGWAMALDGNQTLMLSGQKQTINLIIAHDKGIDTLRELQMQLLTSLNALYDNECIKRDIMPTLIMQGNINFAQLSKDITSPSEIAEILHPEDSEKMMNDAQIAMDKMQEMANKGRDVYYGGFCQTKRYGFFSKLAHWFEPFFFENPEIDIDCEKFDNKKEAIKKIVPSLPFCDNDKYSFVILFSKMIKQIPEQIFNTIAENKAGITTKADNNLSPSSYIRRNYLHDLFRFYQLYTMKGDFVNGFMLREANNLANVFLADRRLFGEVEGYVKLFYDALRFLDSIDTKKGEHYYATIKKFLDIAPIPEDLSDRLFVAHYMWEQGEFDKAHTMYVKMVDEFPNNVYVLRGAARSWLKRKDYQKSLNCYNKLAAINENDINYQLNRSLCLIMMGNTKEALPILYKLYYDNPENLDVVRLKLWAMMTLGINAKIVDEYRLLCEKCPENMNDCLNYGYSLWLSGHIVDAINVFRQYLRLANKKNKGVKSIYYSFKSDCKFLLSQGLSDMDIHIMADAVESNIDLSIN